ncbi:MAG: DnaT-like ssDNA-binding domain-containing protein [Candidatus Contendobacter sp.]|nr:DnaT-like ssDNA-binding domain-containing protein [Candidatus Contendobacter sp.]MDG4558852.1 DnaT-like ssDNA-binding domain-containing protein [Candidatus Contendobacter sp.]
MSRIRTVKPELFKHEALFDAELESKLPLRLAFIGLFTVADREGRFKWRPRTLKLDVLPHDFVDFSAVMNALESAGFIERYEVDGEAYGWIPSFTKHQRFTGKEAETKSQLPEPPRGNNGETTGKHPGASPTLHGETSGKPRGTQEGKGNGIREGEKEGKGERAAQAPTRAHKAKFPLPVDWIPDSSTYAFLEKQGIPRDFAESCLDEFRLYWRENGEHRPGWEATFLNSVKRSYERHSTRKTATPAPHHKHERTATQSHSAITEFLAADRDMNAIEGTCTHEIH